MRFAQLLVAAATTLGVSISAAAAAPPTYTLTDIGQLGGGYTQAYGINASGWITGVSYAGNQPRAFLFDRVSMTNIGSFSGTYSESNAINTSGTIAGWSGVSGGGAVPVTWTGGTMTSLGSLGGSNGYAWGINDSGQATGNSYLAGNNAHRAFRYTNGVMTNLGTFGGTNSEGLDINNNGAVTGWAQNGNNTQTAFIATGNTIVSLGTFGYASRGIAINDQGWVVGKSMDQAFTDRAFVYDGTAMFDLNTLIATSDPLYGQITLASATGITESGLIIANSGTRAFLLTPVVATTDTPEPATLALLATGLFGLVAARRRTTGPARLA
jgi:probable HAF family extracellular repeat protein